ncbi:MAG: hypothetical protein AB1600_03315 [Bacteroidota bacterium]
MIQFELISLLIDWVNGGFQFAIGSITYPFGDVFRTDNIFCLACIYGELYLEVFFFVVIESKGYEE